MIQLKSFYVPTTTAVDLIVIGHEVRGVVKEGGVKNGWVTLIAPMPGATFGMGAGRGATLETIKGVSSLVIPMMQGRLVIEPWQEIYLIDEEKSGKRREFLVQLSLEEPPPAGTKK